MAREFIDGFETGDFALWDGSTGTQNTIVSATSVALSGAQCAKMINGSILKIITARDSYYLAFKWYLTGNGAMTLLTFYNGLTALGTVKLTSNGFLALYSGTATLCATGTKVIQINTVYSIEVYYLPKTDTTGRFVLKINGISELDFTGQTSGNALQIDRFAIATAQYSYFDDVIVDSASWVGPSKIQALFPSGAGSSTQWTASTGANYTCVDEVPPTDTDYIGTNTVNNIDTFAMTNLSGSGLTIKSVQVVARANYSGAPATTSMKGVVRTAGANYASASTIALSTSFSAYSLLWENNPATSSAWSSADVDALEAGVKAV